MFFKKKMQNRVIERLAKRLSSEFVPFDSARKVIFLLESDTENVELAADYLTDLLKKRGVEWIGIVVERANKKSVDFSQKEGYIIIRHKDLTYFGLPSGVDKMDEIKNRYDILIDLSEQYDFTSFYISLLIDARFKVGRYSGESSPYDFIAQAEDSSSIQYIKQVVRYLESIKPARI